MEITHETAKFQLKKKKKKDGTILRRDWEQRDFAGDRS